jgi:hypothetical protein
MTRIRPRDETTDLHLGLSLFRWGDSERELARHFRGRFQPSFVGDEDDALEPAACSMSGLPPALRVTRTQWLRLYKDDWVAFSGLSTSDASAILRELGLAGRRRSGDIEVERGRSRRGAWIRLRGQRRGTVSGAADLEHLFSSTSDVPKHLQTELRLAQGTFDAFEAAGQAKPAALSALLRRCRPSDPRRAALLWALGLSRARLPAAHRRAFIELLTLMVVPRTKPLPLSAGTASKSLAAAEEIARRCGVHAEFERRLTERCVEEAEQTPRRWRELGPVVVRNRLSGSAEVERLTLCARMRVRLKPAEQSALARGLVTTWLRNTFAWPRSLEALMKEVGPAAPAVARAFRQHQRGLNAKAHRHALPLEARLTALGL